MQITSRYMRRNSSSCAEHEKLKTNDKNRNIERDSILPGDAQKNNEHNKRNGVPVSAFILFWYLSKLHEESEWNYRKNEVLLSEFPGVLLLMQPRHDTTLPFVFSRVIILNVAIAKLAHQQAVLIALVLGRYSRSHWKWWGEQEHGVAGLEGNNKR